MHNIETLNTFLKDELSAQRKLINRRWTNFEKKPDWANRRI